MSYVALKSINMQNAYPEKLPSEHQSLMQACHSTRRTVVNCVDTAAPGGALQLVAHMSLRRTYTDNSRKINLRDLRNAAAIGVFDVVCIKAPNRSQTRALSRSEIVVAMPSNRGRSFCRLIRPRARNGMDWPLFGAVKQLDTGQA